MKAWEALHTFTPRLLAFQQVEVWQIGVHVLGIVKVFEFTAEHVGQGGMNKTLLQRFVPSLQTFCKMLRLHELNLGVLLCTSRTQYYI